MMMTPEALLARITYMALNNPFKTAIADSKGDYSYAMLYDAVKGYRCDGPIDIIEGERSFDTVSRMIGAYCNSIPYVCMEEKMPDSFREDLLKGLSGTVPNDVAYVTYTSGTTGKAKGIAIRRKSLGLFVEAFVKEIELDESIVVGGVSPLDFDISVKDIYASIYCGGTYVVMDRILFFDPRRMYEVIISHGINTLFWTASSLGLMSELDVLGFGEHSIRLVVSSAEVMSLFTYDYLRLHKVAIINAYGPTETTCNCTYYKAKDGDTVPLPIGSAFPCCEVYVEDEQLVVRGDTILGYYVTEEGFIPYEKDYYKTGDRISIRDGQMYFAGRFDDQVKYRGHRLELSGVEALLLSVEGVTAAKASIDDGVLKLSYEGTPGESEVMNYLKKKLPSYAIPIVKKERLERNSHNKIKRS